MKRRLMTLIAASLLMLAGCGYKEGVVTGDRKAFLYFSGETENVSVSVDGGPAFSVQAGRDHQYGIEPGTHTIRVMRGDTLVVERRVYVGDGIAKEIEVR